MGSQNMCELNSVNFKAASRANTTLLFVCIERASSCGYTTDATKRKNSSSKTLLSAFATLQITQSLGIFFPPHLRPIRRETASGATQSAPFFLSRQALPRRLDKHSARTLRQQVAEERDGGAVDASRGGPQLIRREAGPSTRAKGGG